MSHLTSRLGRFVLLLLLFVGVGHAQEMDINGKLLTDAVMAQAEKNAKERQALHPNDADWLIRPGVVANRKERWVDITALATGFKAPTPIEFFVVARNGKGYEAMSLTPALPRDVRAAIEFIGMKPGRPVDFKELYFWPRGERLTMTVIWTDPKTADEQRVRVEEFLLDDRTQKPLPPVGLAFVGSRWVKPAEGGGAPQLLADTGGEIASDFNDGYAILDLPYRAVQEKTYDHLSANPAHPLAQGQALRLRLTPELPAGETRIRELALAVEGPATATLVRDLRFTLRQTGQVEPLLAAGEFAALLAAWGKLVEANKDIFITLTVSDTTPVGALPEFARLFDAAAEHDVVRPEPVAEQVYYQAFITNPKWLDRETRLSQPIELEVAATPAGDVAGRMVKWFEVYPEGKDRVLQEHRYTFATLAELQTHLASKADWETDAVFFRVLPATPYGVVRQVANALHATFPTVYVFPSAPAGPAVPTPAPAPAP